MNVLYSYRRFLRIRTGSCCVHAQIAQYAQLLIGTRYRYAPSKRWWTDHREKLEDEAKAVLLTLERQAREAGLTKICKLLSSVILRASDVDIPDKENVDLIVGATGPNTFERLSLLVHLLNTFRYAKFCSLFVTLKIL